MAVSLNSHGPNRHARVSINLAAIRHNYQLLKQTAGDNRLIAVIKADAYGHGAIEVAKALPDADAFAVAATGEAVALRQAGITQKILVLGGFVRSRELQDCIANQLDAVIHHQAHLDLLKACHDLKDLQVWVKVDSGMGRLGFSLELVPDVLEQLASITTLGQVRLMTHLASADEVDNPLTQQQVDAVKALQLEDYEWGIANSADRKSVV